MIVCFLIDLTENEAARIECIYYSHSTEGFVQRIHYTSHSLLTCDGFLLQLFNNRTDQSAYNWQNDQTHKGKLDRNQKQNGDEHDHCDRLLDSFENTYHRRFDFTH